MFNEQNYFSLIESFNNKLPKRNDGRIDYTHSETAAVITIFVTYDKKILLLKRSKDVLTYKGKWNTVAGYLDEVRPIEDKILEELHEELNISQNEIKKINLGTPYSYIDENIKRTWIIHPVLVILKEKPQITLDWEHTKYCWIKPYEIDQYDTVPNAKKSLIESFEE